MVFQENVDLDDLNLGDIVELEYKSVFTNKLAKVVGYVLSINKTELVLSTYDLRALKPILSDEFNYKVKYVVKCDILKKNK